MHYIITFTILEEDDIDDQDGDWPLAVGASTKRRAISSDVLNFSKNSQVAMVTDFNADLTDTGVETEPNS